MREPGAEEPSAADVDRGRIVANRRRPQRSQRYSMLVDNGVVRALYVEAPGKFEVSDADTMLKAL